MTAWTPAHPTIDFSRVVIPKCETCLDEGYIEVDPPDIDLYPFYIACPDCPEEPMTTGTGSVPQAEAAQRDLEQFCAEVTDVVTEITNLLIEKRRGYGPGNITRHGEYGVLVRLDDKTERLRNMLAHQTTTAASESRDDTWQDVIGYGILGLLLERGRYK
jgi:hypothetical protein